MSLNKGIKRLQQGIALFICACMVSCSMMPSISAQAADETNPNNTEITQATEPGADSVTGMVASLFSGNIAKTTATNYQVVNFRKNAKGTSYSAGSTTSYTEYGTGYAGYLNGYEAGEGIYLGTSGSNVKFMISGVIGLVAASKVQLLTYDKASSKSYYYVGSGKLYHYISYVTSSGSFAYSSLNNGPAPSYLKSGSKYYSYDGHYFYAYSQTGYTNMATDYNSNVRTHSVNASNPFYNYYQYLPLRSYSNYTASNINTILNGTISSSTSKMKNTGSAFVSSQNTYGINALLMVGVAANETGWGTSYYAQKNNNLFGINAVDSNPDNAYSFSSVASCIKEFANTYMSKGFCDPTDSRYNGAFLGNKGSGANVQYASGVYWGETAAAIAWQLDKSGGSKDANKYNIGMKDTLSASHTLLAVKASNSSSSATLYNAKKVSSYPFLLLSTTASNGYYKIQSDGVLNSGRTGVSTSGNYNPSSMYAFAPSSNIKIVCKRNSAISSYTPTNTDNNIDILTDGVTGFKNSSKSKTSLKLAWSPNTAVTGYQIYMSTAPNGSYRLVKTISGSAATSWTKTGLSNGCQYYFKIRGYKTTNGSTTYSNYSSILCAYTSMPYSRTAKVTEASNVRSAAGTNYSRVLTVSKGQSMTVYCSTKDNVGKTWYRVKFKKNGRTYYGYIRYDLVSITKTGKVKATSLYMRKRATTASAKVRTLKNGSKVTIKKTVKDSKKRAWYYVTYKKGLRTYKGYVLATYIK